MPYYYFDIGRGAVTAELTDAAHAQAMIATPGIAGGVIETGAPLAANPLPANPVPSVLVNTAVSYKPLDVLGVSYSPLIVADVLADYDLAPGQIHVDEARYRLVTDAGGHVRDWSFVIP